jgi:hypothetical protein
MRNISTYSYSPSSRLSGVGVAEYDIPLPYGNLGSTDSIVRSNGVVVHA